MQSEITAQEAQALASNAPLLAYNGDIKGAIHQVNIAREMAPFSLSVGMACANAIQDISIIMKSLRDTCKSKHDEYKTVQAWFKRHHSKIIPGSVILRLKKERYVPDFMIEAGEKNYPVECKKVFDDKALNQLKAYMEHFGCTHGFAVANRLKTKLPENIVFIECHATTPEDADKLFPHKDSILPVHLK